MWNLAYLEPARVVAAFETIVAGWIPSKTGFPLHNTPQGALIDRYVRYFRKQWLASMLRLMMWNLFRILDYHKTNCDLEGHHYRIGRLMGKKPTLWTWIDGMKRDQITQYATLQKIDAHNYPRRVERKVLLRENKRDELRQKYVAEVLTPIAYLHALSPLTMDMDSGEDI